MKLYFLITTLILSFGFLQQTQASEHGTLVVQVKSSESVNEKAELFVYEGFIPKKERYALAELDEKGFCRFSVRMQGPYGEFKLKLGKRINNFIGKAGDTLRFEAAKKELRLSNPFISYEELSKAVQTAAKLNN